MKTINNVLRLKISRQPFSLTVVDQSLKLGTITTYGDAWSDLFYFIVFRFFQIFSASHNEGANLRLVSFTEGCVQGPQDGRS